MNIKRISILLVFTAVFSLLIGCGVQNDTVSSADTGIASDNTWWAYETIALPFSGNICDYYDYDGTGFYCMVPQANGVYGFYEIGPDGNIMQSTTWTPPLESNEDTWTDLGSIAYSASSIWVNLVRYESSGGCSNYFYQIDWNGTELWQSALTETGLGTAVSSQNPVFQIKALSGNAVAGTNGEQCFYLSQEKSYWIQTSVWIDNFVLTQDGTPYAISYGDAVGVHKVDLDNATLSDEMFSVDSSTSVTFSDADNIFLLAQSDRISSIGEDSAEKTIVRFSENNIMNGSIHRAWKMSDDHILVVTSDLITGTLELGTLTSSSENPAASKSIVSLGYCTDGGLSDFSQAAVNEFNKASDSYYIEMVEYDDSEALDLAIISGAGPDLICMGGLSTEKYIHSGALKDVYPLLQQRGIAKTDLVSSYCSAFETNGALYTLAVDFQYVTMLCRADQYADCSSWSITQFSEALEAQEDEIIPLAGYTQERFLDLYLQCALDQWIDWNTNTCNFETDSFYSLLHLSTLFGTVASDGENYSDGASEYLFDLQYISDFYSVQDGAVYVFPTLSSGGILCTHDNSTFAVSSSSQYADAAGEFLGLLLSERVQSAVYNGFPVLQSAYSAWLQEARQYVDGESVNQLANSIEAVHFAMHENMEIIAIISEESAAFFSGDKTAEDVAKLIQNRVQIYLSEQA